MLQPGKPLQQRPQYVIEEELGAGGFGVTYKAKHQDLNFPVVIKTPNIRLRKDANYPKYVEGFRKEGRTLAKMTQNHHPHIVRIIDFFEEDDLPCLVMDFVKGENLYHLVQGQGVLSEFTAIDYIKQIADALSICHENGIIHRDAHPGNMILRENSNTVVLIDFGLAGKMDSESINEYANPAFAPWEQMLETEKSATIDVYTLAASLFYLLTGDTPTKSLHRKLWDYDLIEPKKLNSNISDKLNQAIIKGLELEPNDRPQSMKEWVELFPSRDDDKSKNNVQSKSVSRQDYTKLSYYLAAGKWKEADKETARLMLVIAKREKAGYLSSSCIDNFPIEDLKTIDNLWVKYSNGRFGFSVQKKIYQGLRRTNSDDTNSDDKIIWEVFAETIGWKKKGWMLKPGEWLYYQDITFDIKAPKGHLPGAIASGFAKMGEVVGSRVSSLLSLRDL